MPLALSRPGQLRPSRFRAKTGASKRTTFVLFINPLVAKGYAMPIVNRQDAADVDAYIQRIFEAPPAQRAQAIRRFFVELMDFNSATGTIILDNAPKNVTLPPSAERIASLQGLNVVYVALAADGKRVRKAEAAAAAKLVADQLGDTLLVFTNADSSQLHFISPTFAGALPSLRRMIIERDLQIEGDALVRRLEALRMTYRLNPPQDGDKGEQEPAVLRIVCSDGLV